MSFQIPRSASRNSAAPSQAPPKYPLKDPLPPRTCKARETPTTKGFSRSRSILQVMLGTFSSRVFGFLRNAVIAFYFGAGEKADVLNFIQAVPMLLRRLAAEGSLETALVPELVRSRANDPSLKRPKAIWRKLLAIQWCIIFPLCLTLVIFPRQIIAILSDFPRAAQSQLAAQMLYYVSPYVFLLSQSVLLGALLSSQQRFTLSSFTPQLSSVAVIAVTVTLQSHYASFAVVLGMLGGIILQLAFLLPPVLNGGYSLLPDFRLRDPAIRRIRRIWLPLWFSTSILALMQFIANYLASQAQSGSVSALTNALIFFQLPQGLIYASIAKVCLPQMSQESASKDDKAGQVLRYGLKQLCILLLPATLVLICMSEALVAVAFQRGAFTLENSRLTAEVLRYYALGSLPIAIFRLLQQYLYAQSHKNQPLLQTLLVALIDIPLSFYLIKSWNLGVIALPVANTLSYLPVTIYAYIVTARHSRALLSWTRWARFIRQLLPKLLFICTMLFFLDTALRFSEQLFLGRLSPVPAAPAYFTEIWSSLRLSNQVPSNGPDRPVWWWHSGGSLRNFGILAAHGLLLLGSFFALCRLLSIPILRQK